MRTTLVLSACVATLSVFLSAAPVAGEVPVPRIELTARRQIQIEARFVGVTYDGSDFVLSRKAEDPETPQFVRVSEQGDVLGSVWQEGASIADGGVWDIHWCGSFIWGSWCQWIRAFSPDGSYQGFFWGPQNPNRAVCHAETNRFWITAPGEYIWSARWNGVWNSFPAWQNITDEATPGANGICYDAIRRCLWVTDGVDNRLYQYDKEGGPILAEVPLLSALYGTPQGCCMAETSEFGNVIAIVFSNSRDPEGDNLVLFEIVDTAVDETSWGSIKAQYDPGETP